MRLFVALELPHPLRRALRRGAGELAAEFPEARWVREEHLHLTLVFLGETDEGLLAPLDRQLGAAFGGHAPFSARAAGAGWFPPERPARVLWLGVEPREELVALHRRVAAAARRTIGGERERRTFRPHVTLARCRKPWPVLAAARWRERFIAGDPSDFPVREGVLIESRLGPGGPSYRTVGCYPLGETA